MNQELLKHPIRVPGNPYVQVAARFGIDQFNAALVNVGATFVVLWTMGTSNAWFLALAGPVLEKVGFFIAHFKRAIELYTTTPDKKRKKLSAYFADGLKGGFLSLVEDVLVHDPVYVFLFYNGLKVYPGTPPWLLAGGSYVIAVVIVAVGEVLLTELRYLLKQWGFHQNGFDDERYLESRFFVSSEIDPGTLLDRMAERFDLTERETGEYEDIYYRTGLPEFSGRKPKFRMRNRTVADKKVRTAQIVYTRAVEIRRGVEQFRFFPQEKEKYYYPLHLSEKESSFPMRLFPGIVKPAFVNSVARVSGEGTMVRFKRTIARSDKEGLYVSVDDVRGDSRFYVVELKVYKNRTLLKEAMRYVMTEFPLRQVTYGKVDMV